jgi:hypothetical protein
VLLVPMIIGKRALGIPQTVVNASKSSKVRPHGPAPWSVKTTNLDHMLGPSGGTGAATGAGLDGDHFYV